MDIRTVRNDWGCHIAAETVKAITPCFEIDRPDVIVYDPIAMAGRVLAHQWSLPAIKISPDFAYCEEAFSSQVKREEVRKWGVELSRGADHFLKRYGIHSRGYMFHREKLNIHLCPRAFDPNGHATDESCFYAGRCAGEQFYVGDWSIDFGDDRPIAAVIPSTFSLDEKYIDLCLEELSELPWNFVLFLPPDITIPSSRLFPHNFRVVRENSPSKTLSKSVMVVCMGGTMTVAEAMYHGLPLVMTFGEPFIESLCDRWVELGLGRYIKHTEMASGALRDAFLEVAESSEIRGNVLRMQRIVRREPGGEEAANRIEEFIERQHL
jgi:MGT family glycosyltransferase